MEELPMYKTETTDTHPRQRRLTADAVERRREMVERTDPALVKRAMRYHDTIDGMVACGHCIEVFVDYWAKR
jgi:hypothetical protein